MTVSRPSLSASGIWVKENIPMNFMRLPWKPEYGSGKARANWIDVVIYVAMSAKNAAKKMQSLPESRILAANP